MKSNPMYKKGQVVRCTKCHLDILRIRRDLFCGEQVHAAQIEGIAMEIKTGDAMVCPSCGKGYFVDGVFMGIIRGEDEE